VAGAAFLIRDAQMLGQKITILERLKLPGGALDGIKEPEKGFVIRGRARDGGSLRVPVGSVSIPSLEIEGASVLDEFYWLNRDDPNSSLQRATSSRGQDAHTDGRFALGEIKLYLHRFIHHIRGLPDSLR
jgi:oleate hydratase